MPTDDGIQLRFKNTFRQHGEWARDRAGGSVDHSFTFGISETVAHFTLDFNFAQFLIGQPSAGFDQNQQMALAFSHVIYKKLQFAGEFHGQTQLNNPTPGVRPFTLGGDVYLGFEGW